MMFYNNIVGFFKINNINYYRDQVLLQSNFQNSATTKFIYSLLRINLKILQWPKSVIKGILNYARG